MSANTRQGFHEHPFNIPIRLLATSDLLNGLLTRHRAAVIKSHPSLRPVDDLLHF